MITTAEDSVDYSQVGVLTSSRAAGSSVRSVDDHRTPGRGAVASPAALHRTQSSTLMLPYHLDIFLT